MSKGFESNKLHQGRVISFSFPDTREVERWVVRGRYITRACSHCNMRKMRELYKLHLYDGATTTEKSKSIMVLLFETNQGQPIGISSNGRAPATHAGGTGIDTRILHIYIFHYYFFCFIIKQENIALSKCICSLLFCFTITSCADSPLVVGAFKVKTF